jgi:hypothetical protein
MVVSRDRNAGRGQSVKTDSGPVERVEEFKYLGTTLIDRHSIQEEITKQIEVRECLLSFSAESFVFQFVSKKLKIKIHRTIIFPVVLYV